MELADAQRDHKIADDLIREFRAPDDAERDRALMRQLLDGIWAVKRSYPSDGPAHEPYRQPRGLWYFAGTLRRAIQGDWAASWRRKDAAAAERAAAERKRTAEAPPRLPPREVVDQAETGDLEALKRTVLAAQTRIAEPKPIVLLAERPPGVEQLLGQTADPDRPRTAPAENPAPRPRSVGPLDACQLWRTLAENLGLPPTTLKKFFYPFKAKLKNNVLQLRTKKHSAYQGFVDNYLEHVRKANPDYEIRVRLIDE